MILFKKEEVYTAVLMSQMICLSVALKYLSRNK